jgi:hypothetical protein
MIFPCPQEPPVHSLRNAKYDSGSLRLRNHLFLSDAAAADSKRALADEPTKPKRPSQRHKALASDLLINSRREAIEDDISQSFAVRDLIIFDDLYCDALRGEAE